MQHHCGGATSLPILAAGAVCWKWIWVAAMRTPSQRRSSPNSLHDPWEDKEDGRWGQRRAYASPHEPTGVSASQASHIPRISWQCLRFLPLKGRLEPVLGNQVSLTMAQTCLGKGCVSHPNCTTHLPVKLVRPRQSLPDLLSQPAGWDLGSHGATNTGLTNKGQESHLPQCWGMGLLTGSMPFPSADWCGWCHRDRWESQDGSHMSKGPGREDLKQFMAFENPPFPGLARTL